MIFDGLAEETTSRYYDRNQVSSIEGRFDRSSFRSKPKVSSIEDRSQFDRRVNDYKNYSLILQVYR